MNFPESVARYVALTRQMNKLTAKWSDRGHSQGNGMLETSLRQQWRVIEDERKRIERDLIGCLTRRGVTIK